MRHLLYFSLLFIFIALQACQKAEVARPGVLNCPLEDKTLYQVNPKRSQYQALIDEYVHKGLPGVILLVKDSQGFYIGSAGMADIKEGIKLQPCHVSKIASITKFMLGVATVSYTHLDVYKRQPL